VKTRSPATRSTPASTSSSPDTFDRIPKDTAWSIERSFFPSLVERKETFVAYVYRGYWIDIGTPDKYMQVHRDIMDRRFSAPPFAQGRGNRMRCPPGVAAVMPVVGLCVAGCAEQEGARGGQLVRGRCQPQDLSGPGLGRPAQHRLQR
jgi:hypothetical protein